MLKVCIVVQCVQVCPDCTDLYTSMETVVSVAEKGCFADVWTCCCCGIGHPHLIMLYMVTIIIVIMMRGTASHHHRCHSCPPSSLSWLWCCCHAGMDSGLSKWQAVVVMVM